MIQYLETSKKDPLSRFNQLWGTKEGRCKGWLRLTQCDKIRATKLTKKVRWDRLTYPPPTPNDKASILQLYTQPLVELYYHHYSPGAALLILLLSFQHTLSSWQ